MKLLCIGDLHIKVDNLSVIDILETQLCELLRGETIDGIVILGDVLHTHEKIHTAPLNRALKLFTNLSALCCPIFILVGNHDYIQNDQFLTDHHWMNVLKNWDKVHVVDRIVFYKNVCFCPYVPVGRLLEALETGSADWKTTRAVFCHQEFEGAAMHNGIVSLCGDKWNADWPKAISGHIHSRQDLKSGVHYVGCALPDNNGKSYVSMYCTELNTIEKVEMSFPKRKKISLSIEKFNQTNLDDISTILIIDNYDDYKIFQKSAPYRDLVARGIAINFKPTQQQITDAETEISDYVFDDLLCREILVERDEFLYCAYERIVNGRDHNEEDILFI